MQNYPSSLLFQEDLNEKELERSQLVLQTEDNLVNEEIEVLRQQILQENEKNKKSKKLQKKKTMGTVLNYQKQQQGCLYYLKCNQKQKLEESTDESISSIDCEQEAILFRIKSKQEKEKSVREKWTKAWIKARAGSHVIRLFSDLHKQIILFGASNQTHQLEKDSSIERIVLMPDGKFVTAWSLFLIVGLLYTALSHPFELAFLEEHTIFGKFADILMDIVFFLDIFIQFITVFEDVDGTLQKRHKQIAQRYLKSWFFIDVLSCFPLLDSMTVSSIFDAFRIIRVVKLPRLLNQVSIFDLLKQFQFLNKSQVYQRLEKKYRTNNAIVRQCLSMLATLIITHIFGCFWFLTSKLDDFSPETWAYRLSFVDQPLEIRYAYSYYWAMQTVATLGYGDIPAVSSKEMLLCLFWMIVGVGFYSFVVGNFTSILTGHVEIEASIQKKIRWIKELAWKADFPLELVNKTKSFLENNYDTLFNHEEEAQLITELPPSLRDEVFSNTYGEIVRKVKFFREIDDPDFLLRILKLLKSVKLDKDDVLYWNGDIAEDIFFIVKGSIKLFSKRGNPFVKYQEGDMFGDCDALLNLPRVAKAIAMTNLSLMCLKVNKDFQTSFQNQEKNLLQMILNARKKRNYHLQLIKESNQKYKAIKDQRKQRDLRNKAALALNGAFGMQMMKQFGLKNADQAGMQQFFQDAENNRPSLFEKMRNKIHSTFNINRLTLENESRMISAYSQSQSSQSPRTTIGQSIANKLNVNMQRALQSQILFQGGQNRMLSAEIASQGQDKTSASPASIPRMTYGPVVQSYFKNTLSQQQQQRMQFAMNEAIRKSMAVSRSPRITTGMSQPETNLRISPFEFRSNFALQNQINKTSETNIVNSVRKVQDHFNSHSKPPLANKRPISNQLIASDIITGHLPTIQSEFVDGDSAYAEETKRSELSKGETVLPQVLLPNSVPLHEKMYHALNRQLLPQSKNLSTNVLTIQIPIPEFLPSQKGDPLSPNSANKRKSDQSAFFFHQNNLKNRIDINLLQPVQEKQDSGISDINSRSSQVSAFSNQLKLIGDSMSKNLIKRQLNEDIKSKFATSIFGLTKLGDNLDQQPGGIEGFSPMRALSPMQAFGLRTPKTPAQPTLLEKVIIQAFNPSEIEQLQEQFDIIKEINMDEEEDRDMAMKPKYSKQVEGNRADKRAKKGGGGAFGFQNAFLSRYNLTPV